MPRDQGKKDREKERQIDGGGSSDRVWVLRRSGAMCSVSSSDLSFLDPPPSRYSGDSLERGKGAWYTRCTCTRHAFLRGRICVDVPRDVSSRERNQKGRQINESEEERVARKGERERKRERNKAGGEEFIRRSLATLK